MNPGDKSVLIIMEGENSEPQYFAALRDDLQASLGNDALRIMLLPEPAQSSNQQNSNRPRGVSRTLDASVTSGSQSGVIKGIPPLSWVDAGKEKLRNGAFSEVWVVFDHDNHPMRKEAFEEAEEPINGKRVNIAFSSRSFEYFMLLHFEQIYRSFEETECKALLWGVEPKPLQCGTHQFENDCAGAKCINGYARSRGYWAESKKGDARKNGLWQQLLSRRHIGFVNANWLRKESDQVEGDVPVWDRNPYVTTDALVKRLTGNWLTIGVPLRLGKEISLEISQEGILHICNVSDHAIIIPAQCVTKFNLEGNAVLQIGDRIMLQPSDIQPLDLSRELDDGCYFQVEYSGKRGYFLL